MSLRKYIFSENYVNRLSKYGKKPKLLTMVKDCPVFSVKMMDKIP